jgi:molecular chaperone GrpE
MKDEKEAATSESMPSEASEPQATGLAADYAKLLAEKQELYDRLLRKQAEFDNYRKRVEREKEDFQKHATADLIRSLLPALDSLERALKHRDPQVPAQYYQGLELIEKEFMAALGRAGLATLETAHQLFDPHVHQAVETVESAAHRDQEIVEELQKGYKLKHRLLRPAIVKVAVSPPGPDGPAERSSEAQASEAGTTRPGSHSHS